MQLKVNKQFCMLFFFFFMTEDFFFILDLKSWVFSFLKAQIVT